MSPRNLVTDHLTAESRQRVEAWLEGFEASWTPDSLASLAAHLPREYSERWPVLMGLISVDMRHRWAASSPVHVEEYLDRFPEIGTRDTIPVSLLYAEYMARVQAGRTPPWEEYQDRFPHYLDELRYLVGQSALETAPQDLFATAPLSPPPPPTPIDDTDDAPPVIGGSSRRMPDRLGRYKILRQLGKGGMGAVYLAHDEQLDREVALKVPHFNEDEDEESFKRFFREARAAARIEHPNICPIYDVGEIDGIRYLTMAYVKGKPLSAFLQIGKPIKVTNAVAVVRKLALALAAAHQKGIVHRDLKPSNIMLNQQSEPILLDFGMAREVSSDQTRLTMYGNLVGTPAYMSPEQVKGELNALGPNCDIYSLGVILYQLLTGHLPFEGETFTVLAKLLTQDPTPPQEFRPNLDDAICRVCLKALARELEDRYQSMQEFAHALTGYIRRSGANREPLGFNKTPGLRDATPARRLPVEPKVPAVNPDGTLDLIYFESQQPGSPDPIGGRPSPRPGPSPFAGGNVTPSPMTLPVALSAPGHATQVAPAPPVYLETPALLLPTAVAEGAGSEGEPHPETVPGDNSKLMWVLVSAAVGLLLTLVTMLVFYLTRPDAPRARASATRATPPPVANVPTKPAEWRTFTPPEGRCSLQMPGTPRKDEENRQQYFVEIGSTRYSLFWGDQQGTFNTARDFEAALDRERERILTAIPGGELVREERITLDGHDGRSWEVIRNTGQQVKFLIRCYQVRQRQYLLYVSFPLASEEQTEAKRYLDSFRLR